MKHESQTKLGHLIQKEGLRIAAGPIQGGHSPSINRLKLLHSSTLAKLSENQLHSLQSVFY